MFSHQGPLTLFAQGSSKSTIFFFSVFFSVYLSSEKEGMDSTTPLPWLLLYVRRCQRGCVVVKLLGLTRAELGGL